MVKARTTRGQVAVTRSPAPAMLKAAQARAQGTAQQIRGAARSVPAVRGARPDAGELYANGEQQAKKLGLLAKQMWSASSGSTAKNV